LRLIVKAQQAPGDWRYLVTSLRTDLSGLGRSDFDFRNQLAQLDQIERTVSDNENFVAEKMRSIEEKATRAMQVNQQVTQLLDDALDSLSSTATVGYEAPGALDRYIRAASDDITTARGML
jgi:hypothetical protein